MTNVTMKLSQPNWPDDYDYPDNNNSSADTVKGTEHDNMIDGGKGGDTLYGGDGNDDINGGEGKDIIHGDDGDDNITGGLGQDELYGGNGSDTFFYTDHSESKVGAPDTIFDFDPGLDLLNLDAIDADVTNGGGDDVFTPVAAFTGTPGEVITTVDEVQGDVDGDGQADLVIKFDTALPGGAGDWDYIIVDDTPDPWLDWAG